MGHAGQAGEAGGGFRGGLTRQQQLRLRSEDSSPTARPAAAEHAGGAREEVAAGDVEGAVLDGVHKITRRVDRFCDVTFHRANRIESRKRRCA